MALLAKCASFLVQQASPMGCFDPEVSLDLVMEFFQVAVEVHLEAILPLMMPNLLWTGDEDPFEVKVSLILTIVACWLPMAAYTILVVAKEYLL